MFPNLEMSRNSATTLFEIKSLKFQPSALFNLHFSKILLPMLVWVCGWVCVCVCVWVCGCVCVCVCFCKREIWILRDRDREREREGELERVHTGQLASDFAQKKGK